MYCLEAFAPKGSTNIFPWIVENTEKTKALCGRNSAHCDGNCASEWFPTLTPKLLQLSKVKTPNMSRMTKQVTAKTQTHKTQAMKAQVEWPNQDGVSPGSEKQIFTHNLLPDCDPGPVYYYVQSEAEFNHTNWIVRP